MRQHDLEIRPVQWADIASSAEIRECCGLEVFNKQLTPIGYAGFRHNELVGWGAVVMGMNGNVFALFGLDDEIVRGYPGFPMMLHRRAIKTLKKVVKTGLSPIITVVEDGNQHSVRWMWRLGFRPTNTYKNGMELWIFTNY